MFGTVLLPPFWLASLLVQPLIFIAMINHGIVEEHDLPAQMYPGQTTTASWSLETGETGGFARFQIQFPEGIIAEAIDEAGASFTFENNRGKFIWIDAPANETIFLRMSLTTTSEFRGGMITQWFSYISNGSRKDVEFEPHHISSLPAPRNEASQSNSNTALTIERTWKQEGADVGQMTLSIMGHEPGQFLKIEESFGAECIAEPIDDGTSSLRDIYDQSILFVWQQAPTDEIIVRYRIMGDAEDCLNSITGKVSSILNGNIVEVQIPSIAPEFESTSTSEKRPEQQKTQVHEPPLASEIPSAEKTIAKTSEDPTLTSKSERPIKIQYRVQVLASHQRVDASHFARHYSFHKALMLEEHEEWVKYVTGSYGEYRDARNEREDISASHNLPGPFVTAYKGNKRITVQEALLTTQQNWIP